MPKPLFDLLGLHIPCLDVYNNKFVYHNRLLQECFSWNLNGYYNVLNASTTYCRNPMQPGYNTTIMLHIHHTFWFSRLIWSHVIITKDLWITSPVDLFVNIAVTIVSL